MEAAGAPPEVAYYYPEPYWLAREGGWIKNLLLFFDEVAILLPHYMYGRHVVADPTLAEPLEDRGLLRILQPEDFVDDEMAQQLADVITALVDGAAFDELPAVAEQAELSMSRMGYGVSHDVARRVFESLERRGLATASRDGVSIPMHPLVRTVYLLVLAQLARSGGERRGLDLHPITNGRGAEEAFSRFLSLSPMPSRGHIVKFDLEKVSIDLDAISLDEVLDFRQQHHKAHRQYMQDLRSFSMELSLLGDADRARALADRREQLREQANDLRRSAVEAWKSPKDVAGFALGLGGAAWAAAAGNPVPAALALLGAGLRMLPSRASGSSYSYLFEAERRLR